MKKTFMMLLPILLAFVLLAGCAGQSAEPEATKDPRQSAQATPEPAAQQPAGPDTMPAGPTPADLLGETYNPFFNVAFPDSYTSYEAEYVKEDELNLYYLYLTAEDTAENVVTDMSNLLGDSAEESIAQNLSAIEDEGVVHIHGTEVDAGLNADCRIGPTRQDGGYDYVDGYEIQLVMVVEPDETYNMFIDLNINLNALSGVSDDVDLSSIENANLRVNVQKMFTQISCGYHLDNTAQLRDDLITNFADDYNEDNDQIRFVYGGELFVDINFNLENNIIYISQMINQTNISIKDYSPKTTLKNLGFEDFRDSGAKCTFKDDAAGAYLSISKQEWGENANEGERNAITFIKNFDDDSLVVFYYPETDVYLILINYKGSQVKYEYHAADDRYVDEHGGDNLENAKEIAEAIFNKPDTDSILQDAWVTFEQYINKAFGINKNELFDLACE